MVVVRPARMALTCSRSTSVVPSNITASRSSPTQFHPSPAANPCDFQPRSQLPPTCKVATCPLRKHRTIDSGLNSPLLSSLTATVTLENGGLPARPLRVATDLSFTLNPTEEARRT